ncbi:hypothetical protein DKX38_011314 [Salix brachista]|uniref:Uncharacterized protein n=1 Tax=Salix brachista TaxID=2182728 RepID=A0A5N5LZ31_9ROSI|nr:hypothetical protein DKX38_011314 [Salix brachista]
MDVPFDSTFFKEFHNALACTVKLLLKNDGCSEAIFFCPKRGDSLDKFLEKIEENGLHFSITENYDSEVWKRHQGFMTGDDTCPSYDKHHCYPLMQLPFRKHFLLAECSILSYYHIGSEGHLNCAILATRFCR